MTRTGAAADLTHRQILVIFSGTLTDAREPAANGSETPEQKLDDPGSSCPLGGPGSEAQLPGRGSASPSQRSAILGFVRTEDGGEVTGDRFDVRIGRRPIGLCHVGAITSFCAPDGETSLATLVLRRAVGRDRTLWEWHTAAQKRRPGRVVSITLLTADGQPLVTWRLEGCRPVRWTGPTLDTMLPAIACEEMEIAFDRVGWS